MKTARRLLLRVLRRKLDSIEVQPPGAVAFALLRQLQGLPLTVSLQRQQRELLVPVARQRFHYCPVYSDGRKQKTQSRDAGGQYHGRRSHGGCTESGK
ncbi:hypothetical protein SLE2022_109390 [Rubroshorea leprosula]